MNVRTTAITLGLVLLESYTGWETFIDEDFVPPRVDHQRHAPDFWFERMTLTNLNAQGLPKTRIHATRMTHYRDDDASEFVDLHYESLLAHPNMIP